MKKKSKPNYTGETREINVTDGGRVKVVRDGKDVTEAEPAAKKGGK